MRFKFGLKLLLILVLFFFFFLNNAYAQCAVTQSQCNVQSGPGSCSYSCDPTTLHWQCDAQCPSGYTAGSCPSGSSCTTNTTTCNPCNNPVSCYKINTCTVNIPSGYYACTPGTVTGTCPNGCTAYANYVGNSCGQDYCNNNCAAPCSGGTGSYGTGSYGTGSYGTGSYGTGSYGTGSYGSGPDSCSVSWSGLPSGQAVGSTFTAIATAGSASGTNKWINTCWKLDGGGWTCSGISVLSNPLRFSFQVTAPAAGSHTLTFGEDNGAVTCSGTGTFGTIGGTGSYTGTYTGSYAPQVSSIVGTVYNDVGCTDNRTNFSALDPSVKSSTLQQLFQYISSCGTYAQQAISPTGTYGFTVPDGTSGNFLLRLTPPSGWVISSQNTGTNGICGDGKDILVGTLPSTGANTYVYDYGLCQVHTLSGSIYLDQDGDGAFDPREIKYTAGGDRIGISKVGGGPGGTTISSDSSGNYSYSYGGTYSINYTAPAGYGITGPNTLTADITSADSPNNNFYIAKYAPVTVNVYNDINANGFQDPGETGIPNLSVYDSNVGTTDKTDANGSFTWNSVRNGLQYIQLTIPSGYQTSTPPVAPGGIFGNTGNWYHTQGFAPYVQNIGLRKNTASGKVYLDYNKTHKSTGQNNYTGPITIEAHNTGTDALLDSYTCSSGCDGTYKLSNLPLNSQFYVRFTNLPSGYSATFPSGTPLQMLGGVGTTCFNGIGDSYEPSACINGDLTNLNFGVSDANPWFQGTSGDMRLDNGFTDPVPNDPTTPNPNPYISLQGTGGTAGIIFYGNNSSPNSGAAQNSVSPNNWKVGGSSAPNLETFTPVNSGTIRTSYSYVNSTATQNNITKTAVPSSCTFAPGCNLSALVANGANHGLFTGSIIYLNGGNYSGGNLVILASSDVYIYSNIIVQPGSTLTVISNGAIHALANGANYVTRMDGFYSAGLSFDSGGIGPNGACTTPDQVLTINGNLVVNANLGGGIFTNNRNLCNNDLTIPSIQFVERPDFYLNAPDLIKHSVSVWQEVAP